MEKYDSVQIYLEEMDDGEDEDGLVLIVRVWVHELSDYGRFVQELQFKMDQCIACYLKICGMPVFNGETEGKEVVSDSDVQDEALKERMRQIEAYLKENAYGYEVVGQSGMAILVDGYYKVFIDVLDGTMSICMHMYFPKAERDELAHVAFRIMRQVPGKWIVKEFDDCVGVVCYVEVHYYEDDDEQVFMCKLSDAVQTFMRNMEIFADTLPQYFEDEDNASEQCTEKEDDIDTEENENIKSRIATVLREWGYSPIVGDGIYFKWQGVDFYVGYSVCCTTLIWGLYLPKAVGDFWDVSSYLFDVLSQCGVKLCLDEDRSDSDVWAVEFSVEIFNSDFTGDMLDAYLNALMIIRKTLCEHYGIFVEEEEDHEKDAVTCDFVFNCLTEGGYSPETVTEKSLDSFLINNAQYGISVYPDRNCCTINSAMENRTGYEFTKEVNAAFTLMSHNTDVTVSRLESDDDGYEHYYLSETLMLSDDKEKFLSDLKLCLEDLDRCTDMSIIICQKR